MVMMGEGDKKWGVKEEGEEKTIDIMPISSIIMAYLRM